LGEVHPTLVPTLQGQNINLHHSAECGGDKCGELRKHLSTRPGGSVYVGSGSLANVNGAVNVCGAGSTSLIIQDGSDTTAHNGTLTASGSKKNPPIPALDWANGGRNTP
jgi:hypothetical protein